MRAKPARLGTRRWERAPLIDPSSPDDPDDVPEERREYGRLIALVALGLMVLVQLAEAVPLQARVRGLVFDGYQRLAPRTRASAPVVIVDIDEASLARFGQWPWPRTLLADLLERIEAGEPAAIGLDMLMPEPDRATPCDALRHVSEVRPELLSALCAMPGNDALLARALASGRVALATAGVNEPTSKRARAAPMLARGGDPKPLLRRFPGALGSLEVLQDAADGHAMINGESEHGVVRRVPLAATIGDVVVPSMAIELLRLASGQPAFSVHRAADRIAAVGVRDLVVPTEADGSFWIHYGPLAPDRYVSAASVLDGDVDPQRFGRRLVLVGVSGLGLVDFVVSALGERVPGVEVHAQILESIYDGTTIRRPAWARVLESAATSVIGLALILGFATARSRLALVATLGSVVVLFLAGFELYSESRILLDPATPSILVVVLLGGMTIRELWREQVLRRTTEVSLQRQREAAAVVLGEMTAARRIQHGMLPDVAITFAEEPRIDVAARMESARHVGGDLYDCFMLDADRAFVLLGDACGKGVPASLFMATSRALFKSVLLGGAQDLAEAMRRANREIARDNPEMLFVTAFAGILDLRKGELCYANAGHEKPFVAAPGRAPVRLDGARGGPLGLFDEMDFPIARHALAPDEFLCVVSDGVTEATDPGMRPFGVERLERALAGLRPEERSRDVLERVVRAVEAFAAGSDPADDLTILVVRCRPDGLWA